LGPVPFGDLAAEGRTVFVSSHLLNELALTAQHLIVIGRGGPLADTGVADFVARAGAAGSGSAAPTRRRWPPGSARRR
jgi:ABC-type multidrug transport system ATPase subunit